MEWKLDLIITLNLLIVSAVIKEKYFRFIVCLFYIGWTMATILKVAKS